MKMSKIRARPYTRKDRVKNVSRLPFAACCLSLNDDLNVHLIYRSLANFAGRELFVVGSDNWFKGATNGLREIVNVTHFSTEMDFIQHARERGYTLVSVEQSEKSLFTTDIKEYPPNPCFILGNETFGMGDGMLLNSDLVVEIPGEGAHPSLNVGCAASVVFYDFISKLQGEK